MHPLLGEPFGIPIHSFGVMVAIAFMVALAVATREARRTGLFAPEVISDLLVWVIVGGIVGARLLYVAVHWEDTFARAPAQIFQLWKGGLVYYGGLFGALLAGWIFTRRRKVDFVLLGDVCLPAAMLGQAIGRIGCFLVGCDYGRKAPDLPWAITFPDNPDSLLPPELRGQPLHPTQLYMLLQALLIFLILTWVARRRTFRGQVLFLAIMLYPIGRSICELFRGDYVERGMYLGLSTSQWISMPLFLIGLIAFMRARRAGRRKGPAATS
ncbi:MAG: prolipoprotein diacylglyceryl transferase [Planctomycetes bacterium]|nr:prolipoprotein diacylglyceryl transferase [Planctomycetota bacterium]